MLASESVHLLFCPDEQTIRVDPVIKGVDRVLGEGLHRFLLKQGYLLVADGHGQAGLLIENQTGFGGSDVDVLRVPRQLLFEMFEERAIQRSYILTTGQLLADYLFHLV